MKCFTRWRFTLNGDTPSVVNKTSTAFAVHIKIINNTGHKYTVCIYMYKEFRPEQGRCIARLRGTAAALLTYSSRLLSWTPLSTIALSRINARRLIIALWSENIMRAAQKNIWTVPFWNEHDELNAADLPWSYSHRFAHGTLGAIRAVWCSYKMFRVIGFNHWSQSEQTMLKSAPLESVHEC